MPRLSKRDTWIWMKHDLWPCRKYLFAWCLPILFVPILVSFPYGAEDDNYDILVNSTTHAEAITVSKHKAAGCAYVLLLMASYWLLETLPMAVTALLPVVCFPLMGILSTGEVCREYMRDTVMIFLASLIAAAAVEESNLHQRLALRVLRLFGTSPRWLLMGFMINTMFLSMWISNTAATALMIPIVDAVLTQVKVQEFEDEEIASSSGDSTEMGSVHPPPAPVGARRLSAIDTTPSGVRRTSLVRPTFQDVSFDDKFCKMRRAIYLGICYSANIGGTGTLTGTGTNLILYGFISRDKPGSSTAINLSFGSWMVYAVPGMLVNVTLAWFFITFFYLRSCSPAKKKVPESGTHSKGQDILQTRSDEMGEMSFHEYAVLWLFISLIALWLFRSPGYMRGWASLFLPHSIANAFIRDSVPAVFVVLLYFMIPQKPTELAHSPPLMNWKNTQNKIAWNVVLLLGGGFALSLGAKASGLSDILGHVLNTSLSGIGVFGVQVITCLIALFLTEVASNATTATILLGVVENVARSMGVNPLAIMVPVTFSCSYAFVLPVASPPNAIIFEAGDMRSKDMAIPGVIMKLICLVVTLVFISFWADGTLY